MFRVCSYLVGCTLARKRWRIARLCLPSFSKQGAGSPTLSGDPMYEASILRNLYIHFNIVDLLIPA